MSDRESGVKIAKITDQLRKEPKELLSIPEKRPKIPLKRQTSSMNLGSDCSANTP